MTTKRKIEIIKDTKDVVKIALGGVIVGGIIKEDYLRSNVFAWSVSALLLVVLFILKTEK